MRKLNQTLCYQWLQRVWNNGEREAIDELLTDDIIAHGLIPDQAMIGKEEFKIYYDNMRKEFKDVYIEVNDVISQDDMESVICTMNVTQISTGKRVKFNGQCLIKIRDGKMAEAWNNFDFLNMNLQLGNKLIPA